MKYVLDSNVVSELSKTNSEGRCVAWLKAHARDCCITTVTHGIERLPEGKRRRELARKHAFLRQDFGEWILIQGRTELRKDRATEERNGGRTAAKFRRSVVP